MTNSSIFSNKVVIITGGSGVLGQTISKAYAKQGAKVVILDLNEKAAKKQADDLEKEGFKALGLFCDVLVKKSIEKARLAILDAFGTCDVLINAAGGNHLLATTTNESLNENDLTNKNITSFFDLDQKGIEFVFNLNFIGTLLPTQVFAQDMLNKGCSIINVSSMNAFSPLTKIPAYSAAKAAISNFTSWLAVHFKNVDIRVNAIAPGFFLTEQNKSLLVNSNGSHTDRAKKILENTPMNRFGNPNEIVGALLFLSSNQNASFINGIVLPIDGGFSSYSGV